MPQNGVVLLADGFEEIEALAPVDVLRRAGLDILLASITGNRRVRGSHGIEVTADILLAELETIPDLLILPGGLPGAENLAGSREVIALIRDCAQANKLIAAICAAPIALEEAGIMKGKRFTCYPGFETRVQSGQYTAARVECDGNIVTGKGPGAAMEFAITLTAMTAGENVAQRLRNGMMMA
ncbi:MAG: DJ-1/PfpI family protein [Lentisphaerae bacterium]|nr:MAG: DJ-1/PfpI family protein [Lentisphaerota bacterium]